MHLLAVFVLLVAATQLGGWLAARLRQPRVIGELLSGVVLGALGLASVPQLLTTLGQAALAVYVFRVVVGLDFPALRAERGPVLRVGVSSFVVPLLAGAGAALVLDRTRPAAVLFLATAFAVTAFPVLARIVADRGLAETRPGRVALGAAAAQELVVWPLVGLAVALGADGDGGTASHGLLVLGAFAGGLVLPARARAWTRRRLDAAVPRRALAVFLPLFFVIPALRVDLGGLRPGLLLGVLTVAVAAKFGSAALAARLPLREALTVGALMNTRGLVELVVLSAGLEAGLIDVRLYTAMVAMALITTVAAGPVLTRLDRPPGGRKVRALCVRTASS